MSSSSSDSSSSSKKKWRAQRAVQTRGADVWHRGKRRTRRKRRREWRCLGVSHAGEKEEGQEEKEEEGRTLRWSDILHQKIEKGIQ